MGNGLKAQSSKLKTKDWREENVRRRAQGVIVGARFIASGPISLSVIPAPTVIPRLDRGIQENTIIRKTSGFRPSPE